jgi:chorismate synthase
LRYLTAGESHGPALVTIVEGMPAGVPVDIDLINRDLARRQGGYGRGGRMKIEQDTAQPLSGLRHGKTLGSPVTLLIENRDWVNWQEVMSPRPVPPEALAGRREQAKVNTRPRPGHADLVGSLKYDHADARNVLERASARETACRVAAGSLAKQLLACFGIQVIGHVRRIGPVVAPAHDLPFAAIVERSEASPVRCVDPVAAAAMIAEIDAARAAGDSLGGVVEVIATGLPPGLGSHVQYDRKLDGRLAGALMSMQAVKGVQIGLGFEAAALRGSQVHDEILWDPERGYTRATNRAGGLEGSMTTGMDLVVQAALKPIATLYRPLQTVDMATHQAEAARVERSDTCAVPAGAVIAECIVAFELAVAMCEKFGGDSLAEMQRNWRGYLEQIRTR